MNPSPVRCAKCGGTKPAPTVAAARPVAPTPAVPRPASLSLADFWSTVGKKPPTFGAPDKAPSLRASLAAADARDSEIRAAQTAAQPRTLASAFNRPRPAGSR